MLNIKVVSLRGDTEEEADLIKKVKMGDQEAFESVIILKYFNDMKIDDISEILGLPVNTIKVQLKRARQSLSNILKEGYLDE